jgi:hypothetical protein
MTHTLRLQKTKLNEMSLRVQWIKFWVLEAAPEVTCESWRMRSNKHMQIQPWKSMWIWINLKNALLHLHIPRFTTMLYKKLYNWIKPTPITRMTTMMMMTTTRMRRTITTMSWRHLLQCQEDEDEDPTLGDAGEGGAHALGDKAEDSHAEGVGGAEGELEDVP